MPLLVRPAAENVVCSDWLAFVRTLEPGSVDLLYADPPFNTGKTQLGRRRSDPANPDSAGDSAPSYGDTFENTEAWVSWLRDRLAATLPAMKPSGSILLHVDWRTSHHARLLLDELLGPDRFVNHLVWAYGLGGSSPRRFARKHDDILFYALDPDRYFFDPPMVPATSNRMKGELKKATDVLSVASINNMASERTGYPTQKPIALLDMLVRACCCEGGLVIDPCCGSGTTLVAAESAGRRGRGCDQNPDAVEIASCRLAAVRGEGAGE